MDKGPESASHGLRTLIINGVHGHAEPTEQKQEHQKQVTALNTDTSKNAPDIIGVTVETKPPVGVAPVITTGVKFKLGRKGDPRMHRAVALRLENPKMKLLDALQEGGFVFPDLDKLGTGGLSPNQIVDEDNVLLVQRKNQLSRRLRLSKKNPKKPKDVKAEVVKETIMTSETSKDNASHKRKGVSSVPSSTNESDEPQSAKRRSTEDDKNDLPALNQNVADNSKSVKGLSENNSTQQQRPKNMSASPGVNHPLMSHLIPSFGLPNLTGHHQFSVLGAIQQQQLLQAAALQAQAVASGIYMQQPIPLPSASVTSSTTAAPATSVGTEGDQSIDQSELKKIVESSNNFSNNSNDETSAAAKITSGRLRHSLQGGVIKATPDDNETAPMENMFQSAVPSMSDDTIGQKDDVTTSSKTDAQKLSTTTNTEKSKITYSSKDHSNNIGLQPMNLSGSTTNTLASSLNPPAMTVSQLGAPSTSAPPSMLIPNIGAAASHHHQLSVLNVLQQQQQQQLILQQAAALQAQAVAAGLYLQQQQPTPAATDPTTASIVAKAEHSIAKTELKKIMESAKSLSNSSSNESAMKTAAALAASATGTASSTNVTSNSSADHRILRHSLHGGVIKATPDDETAPNDNVFITQI